MKKQKRQKYNKGSTVIQKTFKNVGEIEGKFNANQNEQSAELRGRLNLPKGFTVDAKVFKDSTGGKQEDYGITKKLPRGFGISGSTSTNKQDIGKAVSITKGIFELEARQNKKEGKAVRLNVTKRI